MTFLILSNNKRIDMNELLKSISEYKEFDPIDEFRVAVESAYDSTIKLFSLEDQVVDIDDVKREFKDSYITIESYLGDSAKGITIFIKNIISVIKKFIDKIRGVVRKAYLYVMTKLMPENDEIFDYTTALSNITIDDITEYIVKVIEGNEGNLILNEYLETLMFDYTSGEPRFKDNINFGFAVSSGNFKRYEQEYSSGFDKKIKALIVKYPRHMVIPIRAKRNKIDIALIYQVDGVNTVTFGTTIIDLNKPVNDKTSKDLIKASLTKNSRVLTKMNMEAMLDLLEEINKKVLKALENWLSNTSDKKKMIGYRQYAMDVTKINHQRALALLDVNKFKIELAKEIIKRRES